MSSTLLLAFGLGLFSHPLGDAARLQTSLQMAEAAQTGSSSAQTFMELYVLDAGVPVSGVEARVDGKTVATTDEYGAIYAKIPSGRVDFELVRDGEVIYQADLLTDDGEIVLINLLLPGDGTEPRIIIENSGRSSILAGEQGEGTDAGEAPEKEEAPPGALVGQITSAESGEPISGARIFFTGTRVETETDEEGRYEVELPAGTYSVSVIRPGYSTQTQDDVRVIPGKKVTANLELSPAGVRLKDYVVTAPYIEGSIASTIEQQREAAGVSDVLGAAQISAAGDSNAAEALSRVTGLTIEDGKFVIIRGQPYRFTLALFNGSPLPSPEPLVRVVPLDLFPTGVLKDIEVQKAFSPDVPASFGAGLVRINTRGVPDEGFARISLSTGYNSESTFLQGLTYDGGGLDVFGFDDGTRALPASYIDATNDRTTSITNADDENEVLRQFSNNFNTEDITLPPDIGASLSAGTSWDIFGDGKFGVLGNAQWKNKWRRQRRIQRAFRLNMGELEVRDDTLEQRTDNNVDLSGLFTAAVEWEKHQVQANTFLVNQAQDRTQFTTGNIVLSDQFDLRGTLIQWIERRLITQQVTGHHEFDPAIPLQMDYNFLYAQASREAPDQRSYDYTRNAAQTDFVVRNPSGLNREWSFVNDDEITFGLDFTLPVLPEDWWFQITPKFGVFGDFVSRSAKQDRLRWQPDDEAGADVANPNPEELFDPAETGNTLFVRDLALGTGDDYEGRQDIWAVYGMADMKFGELFRLVGGVRYEQANVEVETFTQGGAGTEGNLFGGFDQSQLYPAAALTWFVTDSVQARATYGRSTSRPTLNELTNTLFIDPDSGQIFRGNPDLEPTVIDGYDLRVEWYPSATESLTAGVFWKEYADAIERTFEPRGGGGQTATFQNADAATVQGIEFGGRFEFSRFVDWFDAPDFLDKFYLLANAAILFSEVDLADAGSATDEVRSLDGQADFVLNMQFGYDGDTHDVTLAYNQIGSRLRRVGINNQPNIIQSQIPSLDLNWTWQVWENGKFRLAGENLLNPAVELTQQVEGDEAQVFRKFRKGVDVSLSFAWTFL